MISYETFQAKIIAACREEEAIRAIILVGSRARKERPLDEHADLDLILFTPEPADVQTMPGWIESLAPMWAPDYSHTGAGDPEWEVVYEDGCKVDYTFHRIQPTQTLQDVLESMPYQSVLRRGFKILLDKTGSNGRVTWRFPEERRPAHPSAAQFNAAVNHFLMEAARTVRFIARGDLWRAKTACDTVLKESLLTMIEWQARAKYGLERDVWYGGRYLSEWADPAVTAALPETFAAYDTADLQRAFQATLFLYHRLAAETAAALHFDYPTAGQDAAVKWLRSFVNGE
jgi:aminoglycoside 6-adenylyltransferase